VTARRCKVFLVGEGASDIGSLERIPQYRTSGRHGPGFLQPLIERIVGDDVALEFDGQKYSTILVKDLSDPDLIQGRRARAALAIAGITAGAKALVYLVDTDKEQGEAASDQEARRLHDALRASIEEGFKLARRADPALGDVRTVTGVPLRMLEAWALGDPAAITAAGGDAAKVPPRSETLWSAKRDPSSNYPKHALARALGASPSDGTDADTFATLAACRCTKGEWSLSTTIARRSTPRGGGAPQSGRRCRSMTRARQSSLSGTSRLPNSLIERARASHAIAWASATWLSRIT